MHQSTILSQTLANPLRERRATRRAVQLLRTIGGRILIAFLVMSIITGALGGYAALRIREAGALATKTFDQSLMSINYARAASADFNGMRAAFARRWTAEDTERQALDGKLDELHKSLVEDLTIAGDRSQSSRAAQAAVRAQQAIDEWDAERAQVLDRNSAAGQWRSLEDRASTVDQQIDLLINYTAGDGFTFRQEARAIVAGDIYANLVFTGLALLFAALIAWLLARRIIGPVAVASAIAGQIAHGKLDCVIPPGNGDELGTLLIAMGVMRDNLRQMMEREVAQRRSAQTRLADALESSREGIVVVDRTGRIALANAQMADLLAISPQLLQPGTPIADITSAIGAPLLSGRRTADGTGFDCGTEETRLADGRWLRVSRGATHDGGLIAVLSDLTVLKDQEERLQAGNLSLDAALENMSQGLCLYDADSRLKVVNRRFHEIFHLRPGDVYPGLTFTEVLDRTIAAGNYKGLLAQDRRSRPAELTGGHPIGTVFEEIAHDRIIAVAHRPISDGGWISTYEDVTERREAELQISFLARHDALTRLPNRTLFGERIEQAISRLERGHGFAILCLDLDRFKQVNDTLGHPAGDELLRAVAERLQACVRETDTVARLGGDEFAIVQCGVDRPEGTAVLARRIVEALSRPIEIDSHRLSIGVSIGITLAPGDGSSVTKLMKNADAALYRAKAEGRGTWRCFEPNMDARLQARDALEIDLRQALAEDSFELHYQPIYDLSNNRIGGFEALLRWTHPVRGVVGPSEFVPIAEETGLIVPLGEWVLRRACIEAAEWPDHVKIAVNVSPAQFKSGGLVEAVEEALASSGLRPDRLELEITETVLLANSAAILETLHALRAMGLRFALDDFGTGYSSLSYLRSFPFDKIKIDQSFIRDLTTKPEAGVIVRAITGLGSNLGMRTTAEGVETHDQLARLRIEGCNEVQGYYFSRPVPARNIPELFVRWDGVQAVAA